MKYKLTGREDFISRNREEIVLPERVKKVRMDCVKALSEVVEKNDSVLSMIFCPDSSGLPSGDLALYLGDKVNPEVRDYIQKNLLGVVPHENLSTLDVDDDVIMNLTRGSDESRQAYIARINQYMNDTIAYEKTRIEYENLQNKSK